MPRTRRSQALSIPAQAAARARAHKSFLGLPRQAAGIAASGEPTLAKVSSRGDHSSARLSPKADKRPLARLAKRQKKCQKKSSPAERALMQAFLRQFDDPRNWPPNSGRQPAPSVDLVIVVVPADPPGMAGGARWRT